MANEPAKTCFHQQPEKKEKIDGEKEKCASLLLRLRCVMRDCTDASSTFLNQSDFFL